MNRKGLALAAAVLMSVCLVGCGGGSNGGDAELREPVGEPTAPPGVIGLDRSEDPGEPPADEN